MNSKLIWFTISLIYYFNKLIKNCLSFLSFKDLTHAYLVKTSKTYNKYLTYLLLEDNNLISTKSAAQILSLSLAWAFLLFNSLVTGRVILELAVYLLLLPILFSYVLMSYKYDIHHIYDF